MARGRKRTKARKVVVLIYHGDSPPTNVQVMRELRPVEWNLVQEMYTIPDIEEVQKLPETSQSDVVFVVTSGMPDSVVERVVARVIGRGEGRYPPLVNLADRSDCDMEIGYELTWARIDPKWHLAVNEIGRVPYRWTGWLGVSLTVGYRFVRRSVYWEMSGKMPHEVAALIHGDVVARRVIWPYGKAGIDPSSLAGKQYVGQYQIHSLWGLVYIADCLRKHGLAKEW